jgi:hypothetical protein
MVFLSSKVKEIKGDGKLNWELTYTCHAIYSHGGRTSHSLLGEGASSPSGDRLRLLGAVSSKLEHGFFSCQ